MLSLFDLVSVVEKFYSLEKALKDECVALLIKCNKISASWRHILILFFSIPKRGSVPKEFNTSVLKRPFYLVYAKNKLASCKKNKF